MLRSALSACSLVLATALASCAAANLHPVRDSAASTATTPAKPIARDFDSPV